MAGEIISRGRIVIDLVQGKVDIPIPDFDKYTQGQQQAAQATQQQTQNIAAQTQSVQQLNAQYKAQVAALNEIGRSSFREAKGGSKWDAGIDNMRAAAEAERAELERVNQLILSDRARRHQRAVAMQEAERQAVEQANQRTLQQQRAMGESLDRMALGFMKVSRAAVLLGFSQDESLQDLLRNLALAQAAFDLFDGSRKIVRGLSEAMAMAAKNGQTLAQVIGTGNIALAAAAVAVLAIAKAWESAASEAKKYHEEAAKSQEIQDSIGSELNKFRPAKERARSLLNETGGPVRSGPNTNRDAQRILDANLALRDVLKEQLQEQEKSVAKQRESLNNAKSQVDLAKQRIAAEQGAVQSYEAAFSKLQAFEQKQLKAAFDKLRAGKDITEYERGLVDKVGQSGVADVSRAKEGRSEGADAAQDLKGLQGATVGVNGSLSELEKELDKFQKALEKITAGKTEQEFLDGLETRTRQINAGFEAVDKLLKDNLNKLAVNLSKALKENQAIADANRSPGDSLLGGLF